MHMTYQQIVSPNPNIPCQPGWCLQYVRQTFGAPVVEPTATAGWENAEFKHADMAFPDNCAVPVWFSLATEPAGHVALRMADGSVYSTSDDSTVPHHHPSLDDLIAYYWRNPLTYLGWSEDISKVRVVESVVDVAQEIEITPVQAESIVESVVDRLWAKMDNNVRIMPIQAESVAARAAVLVLEQMPDVSKDVVDAIRDKIQGLEINLEVK